MSVPLSDKQRAKLRAEALVKARDQSDGTLARWIREISDVLKLPGTEYSVRLAMNEERHAYRAELLARAASGNATP